MKSKNNTRVIAYTLRYSSGHLIPNLSIATIWNVGIIFPLQYLHPCFSTFNFVMPIDWKITILTLTCLLFWNHRNYGRLICACSFKRKKIAGVCQCPKSQYTLYSAIWSDRYTAIKANNSRKSICAIHPTITKKWRIYSLKAPLKLKT